MTVLSSRIRSRAWRAAIADHPSIREVCLVGIKPGSIAPPPAATVVLGEVESTGGRIAWLGRSYQVTATHIHTAGGDEPVRYIHLSTPAEG
jgi:hypothetical protein